MSQPRIPILPLDSRLHAGDRCAYCGRRGRVGDGTLRSAVIITGARAPVCEDVAECFRRARRSRREH